MSAAALKPDMQAIVVDEVFPHAPETIWRALTTGALIARWLMEPTGFEAVAGTRFTFKTKAAEGWDGTIHCEVLEVVPYSSLSYAWRGGHERNDGNYGSRLDTLVTFSLSPAPGGTRLRLVHSGFVVPANQVALKGMGEGWKVVFRRLDSFISEQKQ